MDGDERRSEQPGAGGAGLIADPEAARGLARLALGAVWRTNVWTVQTAYRVTRRLAGAARSGESAAALLDEAREEAVAAARHLLGIDDAGPSRSASPPGGDAEPLRERWQELLERSAEIDERQDLHPAFAEIVNHLHPDEARVLRLLATRGPQAAVDVRTWRPLGIGSQVVAPGLTMIGHEAGCLHPERVPAYLANMFRLGLIWFSRDEIRDLTAYQVLEAQPEVLEAVKRAGRATTVRRSIRLTPFGEQFCLACLPDGTGEFEALVDAASAPDAVPPPPELVEEG